MNYDDMSDFEINKLVGVYLGLLIDKGKQEAYMSMLSSFQVSDYAVFFDDGEWHDYCNNPSDAWPIIVESEISIVADGEGYYAIPPISHFATGGVSGRFDFEAEFAVFGCDTHRAAMICFLKMKDAEKQ